MNRRHLLGALSGTLTSALAAPALAHEAPRNLLPNGRRDQSRALQRALDDASRRGRPVVLLPGTYRVRDIRLPSRTVLVGGGTARLVLSGGKALLTGEGCERVRLDGLVLDGADTALPAATAGLVALRACPDVVVSDCTVENSRGVGLRMERCGGHVSDCTIRRVRGLAALYSLDATGLAIRDNSVADCADGGILVHRGTAGEDGTMVAGNRIQRIGASSGGTGQWGNGINVYRAGNVQVADNHVSDCAFSAIRCNSATNATITGNTAMRSGETALYAEFAFQGALVANNLVDGAAVGVSIANFLQGGRLAVVANNVVRNLRTTGPYPAENAGFGIGVSVEADTAVSGNVVDGARWGMLLGWGPYLRNVAVTGNVIREAETGVAVSVVEGAGPATIANNTIRTTQSGRAVIGHRWRDAATADLAGGADLPAHLTVTGNRTG